MSAKIPVTLSLDAEEYERLEAEARRQGTQPDALASDYVRAELARSNGETAEERKRRGLEALDRLAELTADLPPVDAVQIARECREELDERPYLD